MSGINAAGYSGRGLIPRPDLMKKFRALSARKNIFISAPGGYGKTVAATQWLASLRGKTAKILANSGDNDPNVFFRRIARTLGELTGLTVPAAEFTVAGVIQMPFPARHARCYLLIDDLHRIENSAALEGFGQIAARLPEYIRLCVASRSAPGEALMATGLFATLTRNDLLFSPEEVEWLGAEKERRLTRKQINEMLETTGGWAIYLSALLSGGRAEGAQSLSRYLETRVWNAWGADTQETLIRLSIAASITPGLCGRLTGVADGRGLLEGLVEKNAFLSRTAEAGYQFHDIFRDFLLSRAEKLGTGELRRLHETAAKWYFEQGDYLAAISHFIKNLDNEGISRCMAINFQIQENERSLSVDLHLHFTVQYIMKLPEDFIAANPYLLTRCALAAYHNGNIEEHLRWWDLLRRMRPRMTSEYPDLAIICNFIGGIDPRVPLRRHIKELAAARPGASGGARPKTMSGTGTITQNLPFYHRSMRDFSEYHKLRREDLALFRETLGVFMGRNCEIYEQCLMAGMHYEKGDLLKALHHAMNARHGVREDISSEAFVSAGAILAQVLYAMGAANWAKRVLEQTEARLNEKMRCLLPNLKALQTQHAVRAKDAGAAREWLSLYAVRSGHLPLYQLPRHFATLRSYIVLGDFTSAIQFGSRLQELVTVYRRPLDQIECGILIAMAMRLAGENENALKMMRKAAGLALPYGFVQLFINEGKEILPLLLALLDKTADAARLRCFVERLCAEISGYRPVEDPENSPRLPAMRCKMLGYLEKGMSYSEIALAAGIARGTAKRHVLLLYKQLGVHNAAEAVAKAKMMGLPL